MTFQLEVSLTVLKGSTFGSKGCSCHLFEGKGMTQKCFICVGKEQGYGSKSSREMGHFRSTCPKVSIKVILEYHDFRTCTFGH